MESDSDLDDFPAEELCSLVMHAIPKLIHLRSSSGLFLTATDFDAADDMKYVFVIFL